MIMNALPVAFASGFAFDFYQYEYKLALFGLVTFNILYGSQLLLVYNKIKSQSKR